jgi:hypothetical protein
VWTGERAVIGSPKICDLSAADFEKLIDWMAGDVDGFVLGIKTSSRR